MKFKTLLAFTGLCSILVFFANSGRSELVQTINIRLTAHVTIQVSTNGDTRSERMKTVHITTKEILDMLGRATSNDFHGATLVSVNRGAAFQVRHGTNVLADVSGFFTDDDFSADVIDQDFNSTTGKDNYHGFWMNTLTFNDQQGNRFTLSGMIEERYTAKTADAQGMQDVSDLENFNCSGTGTLNSGTGSEEGQFALFNGTIILSGKGNVPLNTF